MLRRRCCFPPLQPGVLRLDSGDLYYYWPLLFVRVCRQQQRDLSSKWAVGQTADRPLGLGMSPPLPLATAKTVTMMVLSQKRSHASTLVDSETIENDMLIEGARLTHLLSKSFLDLTIATFPTASDVDVESNFSGSELQTDIYQQYLNTPSVITFESSIIERLEFWLASAMETMGVGSNSNTLNFWKAHGSGKEEVFADGRYLVWFVKEILLGCVAVKGFISATDGDQGWNDPGKYSDDVRDHILGVFEHWQQSAMDLLRKNGANAGATHQHGDDRDGSVGEGGQDTVGVMWRLLLQNAHLTPGTLRVAFENFSPEHAYQNDLRHRGRVEGDEMLPSEYFTWPSFFRCAAFESATYHTQEHACANQQNKRRRSNNSAKLFVVGGTKTNEWWPLFGYLITYAFISSPIQMTAEQKIIFLKENVFTSLPSMMLIPNFDYKTKNSLLSGIAACVIDELANWIILDNFAVCGIGDEDPAVVRMHEEVCNSRASVSRMVDLLLVDG